MDLEKTMKNLEMRGFKVKYFETGKDAAAYVDGEIDGSTVGMGGSKTVEALGLFDMLSAHNDVAWHCRTPGM